MNDLILQKIEKSLVFKQNKNLLQILSGLGLELHRTDGSSINNLCLTTPTSNLAPTFIPKGISLNHLSSKMSSLKPEVIKYAVENREPQTFLTSDGLRKIIIPIIVNDDVVGLMVMRENNVSQFKDDQKSTITNILLQVVNYIIETELSPINLNIYNGKSSSRQKELLDRAVNYIRKNFHSNTLSLKDVAEHSAISYHHLSRLFKKELNTNFAEFRNQIRMEAAAKLLKQQNLSVSQISYACGFEDPAYFCKVFKEFFNTSPLTYRKKLTKSKASNSNRVSEHLA